MYNKIDTHTSFFQCYYVAPQRLDILRRVNNDFAHRPLAKDRGLILSGPDGCGKSAAAYLLAAHAFINRHCVLYVPDCKGLIRAVGDNWADNNLVAKRMLEQFSEHNADLVESLVIRNIHALPDRLRQQGVRTLGQLLQEAVLNENIDVAHQCEQLLQQELIDRTVVDHTDPTGNAMRTLRYYRIYDGVNGVFRPRLDHINGVMRVPASSGYFSRFRSWKAPSNFFTCQLSSANSSGESPPFLANANKHRIIPIQPLPAKRQVIESSVCGVVVLRMFLLSNIV